MDRQEANGNDKTARKLKFRPYRRFRGNSDRDNEAAYSENERDG